MICFRVEGIGVVGPGISGRGALENLLFTGRTDITESTEIGAPEVLNPRERRRASPTVRLALSAASEAVGGSGRAPDTLPMVFASSLGDGTILNDLLDVLVDPARHVSPTRFHNSVHNAALAYWSIGTGNRLAGSSLAAHNYTFGAALLKSAAQIVAERCALLLVVYDHPFAEPLNRARPLLAPFATAFVLSPSDVGKGPRVCLSLPATSASDPTPPRLAGFRDLWRQNPAARALPFLEALVHGDPAKIDVAFRFDRTLRLEVSP